MRTSVTQLDKNYLKIYKLPNALLPLEEEITQEIQQEIPQQQQPIYVPNNDALKTNSYYKKLENNIFIAFFYFFNFCSILFHIFSI